MTDLRAGRVIRADHVSWRGAFHPLWAYLDKDGRLHAVIDAENESAAMTLASGWDAEGARAQGFRVVRATVEWKP